MDINIGDKFIPQRNYMISRNGRLCTICDVGLDSVWWHIEGILNNNGTPNVDGCTKEHFPDFLQRTGATLIATPREPDWEV
jgi:hypothetical protein